MKRLDEPFTVLPQNYTVPDPLQSPAPTASPELEDPTPTASVTIDSAPPLPTMYLSEDSSSQHTVIDPRDANDPDYVPESSETPKVNVSTYLNINLDKLAPELERDGGGIESNARKFTKFMGILHEEGVVEQKYVIPRSKLESAIKRNGKRKLEELANRRPLAIFFDGKEDKDIRMCHTDKDGKVIHTNGKRSHYSVVEQPDAVPLGMFVPDKSTGVGIAVGLYNYLDSRGISTEELRCLGGDNTNANSGYMGGAIREFELLLGRAVQRAFCLLHQDELPLRQLYFYYGGGTQAPGTFTGPLGDFIMSDIWTKPIRNFKKIGKDFPRLDRKTLHGMSTDSQQMYRYCVALETGLYDAFVNLKIGNCSTARWITFGTRILRVYMSAGIRYNAHVAECLERMVNFIVNIYYKVFSNIKLKGTLMEAPSHLFDQIKLSREHCLPGEQTVIFQSIQQNSFMAHPECIILAMLGDQSQEIRERGLSIVRTVRASEAYKKHCETESGVRRPKKIRLFLKPKINFKCRSYTEMIQTKYQKVKGIDNPPKMLVFEAYNGDWEPVTIPPLIADMTTSQLEKFREEPFQCSIPCHSQSVEHTVALVSQATRHRRTEENQLMSVLQTHSARKEFSGSVTHKRFAASPLTVGKDTRKIKRFQDTPFNKVLYKS